MKRLFRALRLFLEPLCLPKPMEWTPGDAVVLRRFLATGTGARLRMVMISRCAAMNEYATDKAERVMCGYAQGTKAMMALILSCAATDSGKSNETPADTDGTADDLEHLRP